MGKFSANSWLVQEKTEKLHLLLEKLAEKSREGAIIFVEGVRDVEALRSYGIEGEICCIKNRRIPIYDLLNKYINIKEELIILTDFDRRGVQLAKKIAAYMEKHGKHVNLSFWSTLYGMFSSEIKDVEGISSYLKNARRKFYKMSTFPT
ncbi:MAG: hypothetical protein DRO36_02885 [Candidatus Hecatellales archaeon]|nr:MAG: hypothetical protein DRO36_02885 [Candidatus Hecatellales archaeon]